MDLNIAGNLSILSNLIPELHHYTNLAGLKGICDSNTIWATHYRGLNDTTELEMMRPVFANSFASHLEKQNATPQQIAAVRHAIDGLYHLTFHQGALRPEGISVRMEPFIASFCSHAFDQPYEKENGLLSQWRGYGGDGGYCLVFDTAAMLELFVREQSEHHWYNTFIGPAIYSDDEVGVRDSCRLTMELFSYMLKGGMAPKDTGEKATIDFICSAVRLKHQGFKEEREFRIAMTPIFESDACVSPGLIERSSSNSFKAIHQRISRDRQVKYLALFGGLSTRLPITRIIVGPARHQHRSYMLARDAVGSRDAPIVKSRTPFVA